MLENVINQMENVNNKPLPCLFNLNLRWEQPGPTHTMLSLRPVGGPTALTGLSLWLQFTIEGDNEATRAPEIYQAMKLVLSKLICCPVHEDFKGLWWTRLSESLPFMSQLRLL